MYSVLILFSIITIINAKTIINVAANNNNMSKLDINYEGYEQNIMSDKDIELFKIDKMNLRRAVKSHYGSLPRDVYLKSPTPWGDLYKLYNWEEVIRILRVKEVRIKRSSIKQTTVLSQDFENPSNLTIKVNAGISQTVENTISTTWSQNKELTVSQEFEYDLNVIFAKLSGTTSISYTSSWGKNEEKSESVTIGSTSAVEAELKPGQAATAVLSANRCLLEIEVVYVATLRGNVAVNYRKRFKGHHFYGPSIIGVLESAGLDTEIVSLETIKIGMFMEASLKVSDRNTGLAL